MKTAAKESVIASLEKYTNIKKAKGRLINSESCMCIEGIFCKVAADLGFNLIVRKDGVEFQGLKQMNMEIQRR
jgi:hypothetical protein